MFYLLDQRRENCWLLIFTPNHVQNGQRGVSCYPLICSGSSTAPIKGCRSENKLSGKKHTSAGKTQLFFFIFIQMMITDYLNTSHCFKFESFFLSGLNVACITSPLVVSWWTDVAPGHFSNQPQIPIRSLRNFCTRNLMLAQRTS